MSTYYKQTDPQHNIRIPIELKTKIAESAKAHNRSMNADMVARLEKSFETDSNQVALLQEEITLAMKNVMNNLVSNAVNNLLQQGVDENVVENAFTSKPK